jgi:hypothetical protein
VPGVLVEWGLQAEGQRYQAHEWGTFNGAIKQCNHIVLVMRFVAPACICRCSMMDLCVQLGQVHSCTPIILTTIIN